MTIKSRKDRPYWHVDLKWIFGIFAFFFLILSLILFTLSKLTSEKTAIPLTTFIVASQFSRDGLDDPKDIEEAKSKFLNSGQEVFYPLGRKDVRITKQELETLPPKELRLKIFRQVVEPYYYESPETVANRLGTTEAEKEQIKKEAGLLGFFNQTTHQTISHISLMSIIPVIMALSGLIFFSFRYGRLISPAMVFLLVSTLPSLLFFLIQNTNPPPGENGPFSSLHNELVKEVTGHISAPFYAVFIVGICLLIIAAMKKALSKLQQKKI